MPDDVYTDVKIDLDKEIAKYAEKSKVATKNLDKSASVTYRELFRRIIIQYYAGRDFGYREGFLKGTRVHWRWYVWFAIGATSLPLARLVYSIASRFSEVIAAVWSAVQQVLST